MATIGVLFLGALLGSILAIFGGWIVALLLSTAAFLTWFGIGLTRGDGLVAASLQSFALASVVQVSYVLSGYVLPILRPYLDRIRGITTEDGTR